jgi:hypothetical protein
MIAVYNSEGCVGRCDAKCYDATESDCDCICGGRNHGAGLQQALENAAELFLSDKVPTKDGTWLVIEPELFLTEADFEVAPTDEELCQQLPPDELLPLLIDAAASADHVAADAERKKNATTQAEWELQRDELLAQARTTAHTRPFYARGPVWPIPKQDHWGHEDPGGVCTVFYHRTQEAAEKCLARSVAAASEHVGEPA